MRRPISGPDPNVVGRRMGSEFVLIHLQTDRAYALNRTGARCWELLAETGDREWVQERLAGEFVVPAAALAEDLDHLLALLVHARLLVSGSGPGPAGESSTASIAAELAPESREAWEPMNLRYLGTIGEFVQAGSDKSRHHRHRHHGW